MKQFHLLAQTAQFGLVAAILAQAGMAQTALAQTVDSQTTSAQTTPVATTTAPATTTTTGAPAAGTSSTTGAYEKLSPGNKRIADALFDGQSIGTNGGEAWSLDKIAATHQDGRGWGEIFKDMKSQGLTDAKNLGELVSGRYQARTTSTETGSEAVTITTARGRTDTIRTGRGDHENQSTAARGSTAKPGRDGDDHGMVTGRGTGTQTGARAGVDHRGSLGVGTGTQGGRSAGIVTARGGGVGAGSSATSGGGRGKSGKAD